MDSHYPPDETVSAAAINSIAIQTERSLTDKPVVGLQVTGSTDANDLARSIQRAQQSGYPVVVYAVDESPAELLSFIDHHDVPVLWPDKINGADPEDALVAAAKEAGYPGLLWHTDLTSKVDFESSITALQASERYAIDVGPAITEKTSNVIVGIPAYNEEVGIGSVIIGAEKYADEVIVIDDGSSDRTVEVADEAGATVIEHDQNRGKGAAMRTLFEYVEHQECDVLVTLDGDGQHVPDDIESVVRPVLENDAEVAIGSRYVGSTEDDETPLYRRVGQKVLDTLTLGSSAEQLSDTQSGFRAFSPTAIEQLSIRTTGMGVESEMISEASEQGLDIAEVPIDVRYEGIDGQTHNPFRHGLEVLNFLIKMVRDRHPLLFFGLPGLLLALFGGLYGLDGILIYQNTGVFYPAKVLVSGFTTVLGILGVFTGLTLNQVQNMMATMTEDK